MAILPPVRPRGVDPVRFQLDACRTYLYKRVVRTVERGLNGDIPAKKAPSYAVGLKAAQLLLERIDPVAKAEINAAFSGPVIVQWKSSSITSPAPSSESFTTPSLGNGHAPPSSSATDDLENL